MANTLTTSAEVGFGKQAGRALVVEPDPTDSLEPEPGVSFIRVFPSSAGATVTAVMGSASRVATRVPEEVIEYVSFSGSTSAGLQYPPETSVTVSDRHFFKPPGVTENPSVAYDADTVSIVLDKEAYGIVKVKYTAYYNRYRVRHGDSPCRAARAAADTSGDPTKAEQLNYDPAYVVAAAEGWATTALEVSGPPCERGSGDLAATRSFSEYTLAGLRLEVDPLVPPGVYPYYFARRAAQPQGFLTHAAQYYYDNEGLYAGCRIIVYSTRGLTLKGLNCVVGTERVREGVLPITQALSFSGSSSASLNHVPYGGLSLTPKATALDMYGNMVDVIFRGPGERVNEVLWMDSHTYELADGARLVRENEVVVVTDLGNNTIPCYTFAAAEYTAVYSVYEVLFGWSDTTNWYLPAAVLATDDEGRTGYLNLSPPARGGVL